MKMPMSRCRYWLLGIWLGGAGLVAVILFAQQVFGNYGEEAGSAWSWFTPNVVPTLSLMVAVLVAAQAEDEGRLVDRAFFLMTLGCSGFFLLLLLLTVLLQPFVEPPPLDVLQGSAWYLVPFQGLATGMLGAFFIKKDA